MADKLPDPAVPELARAKGETVAEMCEYWIDYYNTEGAPFNYRRSTRAVAAAYKGLHRLQPLVMACRAERTHVGRVSNTAVVSLAAPLAFGRTTQVFNLPARRFPFGRDRKAAYRIPFFFVEDGVIKLYFLQPRKGAALEFEDFCMVASIVRVYLLEAEFFGQRYDVEFVDTAALENGMREIRKYSLQELPSWSEKKLSDRLTLISESLDLATTSGRIEKRRRIVRRPDPEMPLFD
jgi:hypothetical protein